MTPDLDPLSPEIESLLDAERRYEPEPLERRERVLARLVQTTSAVGLGLGAGHAAAHAGAHAAATWLDRLGAVVRTKAALAVGALVVGSAVGATVGYRVGVTRGAERATLTPRAASATSVHLVPPVASVAAPVVSAEATPSASEEPRPRTHERAPTPRAGDAGAVDLVEELALVQTARTAIARGNYAGALDATDEHARRFPRGHLAEERESLAIQALAGLGRGDEARARATKFRAKYPQSLLLPAVDGALRTIP